MSLPIRIFQEVGYTTTFMERPNNCSLVLFCTIPKTLLKKIATLISNCVSTFFKQTILHLIGLLRFYPWRSLIYLWNFQKTFSNHPGFPYWPLTDYFITAYFLFGRHTCSTGSLHHYAVLRGLHVFSFQEYYNRTIPVALQTSGQLTPWSFENYFNSYFYLIPIITFMYSASTLILRFLPTKSAKTCMLLSSGTVFDDLNLYTDTSSSLQLVFSSKYHLVIPEYNILVEIQPVNIYQL